MLVRQTPMKLREATRKERAEDWAFLLAGGVCCALIYWTIAYPIYLLF